MKRGRPSFSDIFVNIYGVFSLGVFVLLAIKDGSVFRRRTREEQEALRKARHELWAGNEDFRPAFEIVEGQKSLHFVSSGPADASKDLIVFIHGFPDSCYLWSDILKSPSLLRKARLIAIDLPGSGGSDSLEQYDAQNVLDAVASFIVSKRKETVASGCRCIVVGHDWGGLIAYRLAAELPSLADRFIVVNSAYPTHAKHRITDYISNARDRLLQWQSRPLQLYALRQGANALRPVVAQILKSNYAFIFNLPKTLTDWFGKMGNQFFLRSAHRLAARRSIHLPLPQAAQAMASSLGPSLENCVERGDYPNSVRQRAKAGAWPERIRLYSEGLTTGTFDPPHHLRRYVSSVATSRTTNESRLSDILEHERLKAPCTVLFGLQDPALDSRICLDGVEDYMGPQSQVIRVPHCGHWLPIEPDGHLMVEAVCEWALDRETEDESVSRLRTRLEMLGGVSFQMKSV
ncbi:hypothetical protein LTR50_006123 [Elasticomyces elasticus]|nr:hypothetical protein LTR50_006123 [Elasticomyces elasticus]